MKVHPALKAHQEQQHKLEVRLQKEAETKREVLKKAAKEELELVLYEKKLQMLYLIKQFHLGKNIDKEC
jgi:hypothetical protein